LRRTAWEGCVANVLKQFRRRYIYPWLKPPLPLQAGDLGWDARFVQESP